MIATVKHTVARRWFGPLAVGIVMACGDGGGVTPIPIPVLAAVNVTPTTLTLSIGSTGTITATPVTAAGVPVVGQTVTFSSNAPTKATVNSAGLVTGVAAGTATVTATAGAFSASVAVTVNSAPVTQVKVTPLTLTLTVGGTQALNAFAADAAGNPVPGITVTYVSSSPAVATVNVAGVVTAVAVGTDTITASASGFSTKVPVSVNAIIVGSGTAANPGALPVVASQRKDSIAYAALNVPARAAGTFYIDPVAGTKIWKVTSPTVPSANSYFSHNYSEGPTQISREYGAGIHTLMIQDPFTGTIWFVDFHRSAGLTNYRQAPSGTYTASFAKDSSTPSLAYIVSGAGVLRKYDVATNSIVTGAPFPVAFPGLLWFQTNANDTRFAAISITSANDVIVYDKNTGVVTTKSFTTLDEPYMERDGNYLMANTALTLSSVWDLNTNLVTLMVAPGNASNAHLGTLRGYFVGCDPNTGGGITPLWAYDPSAARLHFTFHNMGGYYPDSHHSGQWLQSNALLGGNLKKQWFLREQYNYSFLSAGGTGSPESIVMLTLDGLNYRLVGHHYSIKPPPALGANFFYYSTPRTTISLDGKLIMFDTNMNGSTRIDTFLVEVPII